MPCVKQISNSEGMSTADKLTRVWMATSIHHFVSFTFYIPRSEELTSRANGKYKGVMRHSKGYEGQWPCAMTHNNSIFINECEVRNHALFTSALGRIVGSGHETVVRKRIPIYAQSMICDRETSARRRQRRRPIASKQLMGRFWIRVLMSLTIPMESEGRRLVFSRKTKVSKPCR